MSSPVACIAVTVPVADGPRELGVSGVIPEEMVNAVDNVASEDLPSLSAAV
jgi:hypothetical protein